MGGPGRGEGDHDVGLPTPKGSFASLRSPSILKWYYHPTTVSRTSQKKTPNSAPRASVCDEAETAATRSRFCSSLYDRPGRRHRRPRRRPFPRQTIWRCISSRRCQAASPLTRHGYCHPSMVPPVEGKNGWSTWTIASTARTSRMQRAATSSAARRRGAAR